MTRIMKNIFKIFTKRFDFGNNEVNIPNNNKHIKIKIKGQNNKIIFSEDFPSDTKINIEIYGDSNIIHFGPVYGKIKITIGYDWVKTNNSVFKCGSGRINEGKFVLLEDNTKIIIGNKCLFSWGIEFRCTDDHTIMDMAGNIINRATSIEIGDHVWIAKHVTVLKNSKIMENSVIGCNSVVAKQFDKSNVVIAGNPAKIVKENVQWDEKYINEFNNEDI